LDRVASFGALLFGVYSLLKHCKEDSDNELSRAIDIYVSAAKIKTNCSDEEAVVQLYQLFFFFVVFWPITIPWLILTYKPK